MDNDVALLSRYNEIFRKSDEVFHSAVKSFNISDGAFWVLYTLRDMGSQPTQRDVYKNTCMPKQTVNSALNKLEADGYIELCGESGSRNRIVRLTPSGEELARRTADVVRNVENVTMAEMPEGELRQLIELTAKYTDALAANMKKVLAELKSNDK